MKYKKYLITALLVILSGLIIFLRRPEILAYAQFWAEDGRVWYANAHNLGGLPSLFMTQDGYFQTLSRLTAGVSLFFSLESAPLVFNLTALLVQLIPIFLIASGRLNPLIPDVRARLFLGIAYLLLPNTAEVSGNLTNAQWYLALSACLVLLSDAGGRLWKWFDAAVILLSGLSGPFAIFLLPIALVRWRTGKGKRELGLALIVAACTALQAAGLLFFSSGTRDAGLVDGTVRLFFATLNRQVFMGAVLGVKGYLWVLEQHYHPVRIFAATCGLSMLIGGWTMLKAGLRLRLFLFFGAALFLAALFNPTVADHSIPVWKVLSRSIAGARYWLIPMLGFAGCLVWNLRVQNPWPMKVLAGLFLASMTIGIVMDWKYDPYVDYRFAEYTSRYRNLENGAEITIPINPPGWDMTLVKH